MLIKIKKSNQKKSKYSVWSNIMLIFFNLWRWDKKLLFFCIIKIFALVVLPLSTIYLPKLVIDELNSKTSPERLIAIIGGFSLFIILANFLNSYMEAKIRWGSPSIRFKYNELIGQKTMDTDYENIDNPEGQKKGQKAITCVNDFGSGTDAIIKSLIQIIASFLGFILYGGIISLINPLIVVLLIITTAINYFMLRNVSHFEHKNKDNWAMTDKKLRYVSRKAGDFENSKDIRLYNMVDWFTDLFQKLINDRLFWNKRITWKKFFSAVVDLLLVFLRDGVAYAYLIYLILLDKISVANFILYFGAVAGFSGWLSGIITELNTVNATSLGMCDLRDYLDMPDKSNRGEGIALPKYDELPCSIEFKDVTFKYSGCEDAIIENFNLKINKGEKIAIAGVNGAGKTTIVKLLCGLYRPVSGQILINDKNICEYNRDDYYSLFSAVFQDIRILPVSIAKNISMCNDSEVNRDLVSQCLELAGLDKVGTLAKGMDTMLMKNINETATDLSGGEMQKLLLARALYKDAPIIVLDEPTAALDPISENQLYLRYGELTRGKTSVFISHRLSSTRFCDKIVFLERGKIAEFGSHYELMSINGKYAEMFNIQSHYYKDKVGGELYA